MPVLGPGAALAVIGSVTATATAAGTTQGTATAITTVHTNCTTATEGQGFVLPTAMTLGDEGTYCNATSATTYLYPPSGGQINGMTANIPVQVPANYAVRFIYTSGTNLTVVR